MDWNDLAQDKERWRTLVNTVMNIDWASIKSWEVVEQLHNWRLIKKGSAQLSRLTAFF
jgi:hypothetical protein